MFYTLKHTCITLPHKTRSKLSKNIFSLLFFFISKIENRVLNQEMHLKLYLKL